MEKESHIAAGFAKSSETVQVIQASFDYGHPDPVCKYLLKSRRTHT